jgi:flagellar export protein FliJ
MKHSPLKHPALKHPLDRLLRLRSLLADVSRLELEARLQELAQVESALTRLQQTRRAMRQRSFAGIAGAQNADWLEAEVVGEWVAGELGVFEKARQQKTVEANTAKAAYLERRKECRQVETVIDAQSAAAAIERDRREQQELDDWFGQRSRPGRTAGNGPA